MTQKRVWDTPGGKLISAWVVLDGSGKLVGRVQAYFSKSGGVLVNVYDHGGESVQFQGGRATGYGYDKLTAAMSGLTIDGHELSNHCGRRLDPPDGLDYFPLGWTPPKGYRTANRLRDGREGYSSCFKESGLDYLKALGYRVIEAI